MTISANQQQQPQNEPELRELIRRVLRGTCIVAAFISAAFAAHGVVMTLQILNDEVPAGKVAFILGETKMGTRVRLENGGKAAFE